MATYMKKKVEPAELQFVEAWDKFVQGLKQAEEGWNKVTELRDKIDTTHFLTDTQLLLSRLRSRARFSIFLPRLLDYVRAHGGFESVMISAAEMRPKKEEERNVSGK